jgi:hypothetical protein
MQYFSTLNIKLYSRKYADCNLSKLLNIATKSLVSSLPRYHKNINSYFYERKCSFLFHCLFINLLKVNSCKLNVYDIYLICKSHDRRNLMQNDTSKKILNLQIPKLLNIATKSLVSSLRIYHKNKNSYFYKGKCLAYFIVYL